MNNGIATVLRGILNQIVDSDLDHPHAWENADLKLQEAQILIAFVLDRQKSARFAKSMALIDESITKINHRERK